MTRGAAVGHGTWFLRVQGSASIKIMGIRRTKSCGACIATHNQQNQFNPAPRVFTFFQRVRSHATRAASWTGTALH